MPSPRLVRDVMTTEIRGISEESDLLTAARMMTQERVNSLVVWPKEKERPYGILTSSDLVDAIAGGVPLDTTTVASVHSTPLVLVTPGVPVRDAARMMKRLNLRHLAVFNGKDIVGVVSSMDLVRGFAHLGKSGPDPVNVIL